MLDTQDRNHASRGVPAASVWSVLAALIIAFFAAAFIAKVFGQAAPSGEGPGPAAAARAVPPCPEAAGPGEAPGDLPEGGRPTSGVLSTARKLLERLQATLERLLGARAGLEAAIVQLRAKLEEREAKEGELKALEDDLKGRDEELERLKREKERLESELARAEAEKARAGKDKVSFKAGTPIVNRQVKRSKTFDLVLAKGKVLPVEAPYYKSIGPMNGILLMVKEKDVEGLGIEDALKPGSALVGRLSAPQFKITTRVRILLNGDSFAAFRAMRDELVDLGIEYGWVAYEGTNVFYGSGGKDAASFQHGG
ncbi:MAG: hypothetical protein HY721_09535 [Planctomycetes bacterium]|nr:hypothetical protein [Planctomycetota bacterium]